MTLVGRATDKKLKNYGIHTIGNLANMYEKFLATEDIRYRFGKDAIKNEVLCKA